MTGDAVDVIRRRLVHRLHHTNTEVFSCSLWKAESETRCLPNSPRATPFTIEIQEEQPIQPIKKQEKGEKQILNGQSFVFSFLRQQVETISRLVPTLAIFLRKDELVCIQCGLQKTLKVCQKLNGKI